MVILSIQFLYIYVLAETAIEPDVSDVTKRKKKKQKKKKRKKQRDDNRFEVIICFMHSPN